MKKTLGIILICILCFAFIACGKKDETGDNQNTTPTESSNSGASTTSEVLQFQKEGRNLITGYKTGDVTLGQYTGITYKPMDTEVTEEEVQEQVDKFADSYKYLVEIEGRDTVQDGDVVDVAYKGLKDGVAFQGGTGTNPSLKIGSNTYIPDFEAGVKGHKKGESFSIDCTFPENYKNADLAGQKVVFDITLNGIYEYKVPEMTDALVAEKTDNKYETVEAYKEYVRTQLKASKEEDAEVERDYEVIEKLIDSCTFNMDIDAAIERGVKSKKAYNDSAFMSAYGIDAVGYYTTYLGITEEQYNDMVRAEADLRVRYEFILSAIAEAERFQVTDEEVDEFSTEQMKTYAYADVNEFYNKLEELNGVPGRTYMAEQLKINKAADLVFETAVAEG